jgi:prepilin-type N-terminal cleavage/methylation domain-containing protein
VFGRQTVPTMRYPVRRRGFSLLELIVVLLILAVLAALAVPTYHEVINRVYDEKARTELSMLSRNAYALAGLDGDVSYTLDNFTTAATETNHADGAGVFAADTGLKIVARGVPSTKWGEVSLGLNANAQHALAAMRSQSGRCIYVKALGSATSRVAGPNDPCLAQFDEFTPVGDPPAGGVLPTEATDPTTITPAPWVPSDTPVYITPVEDDPDFLTIITPGPEVDTAPTGLSGVASFISTAPPFPHPLMVTDQTSGTLNVVVQRGPDERNTSVHTLISGLAGPRAVMVGPDVIATQPFTMRLVYIGVASDGGSLIRFDPVTKEKVVVATGLGESPTGLTGFACFNPGSAAKLPGRCVYASAGSKIWRIDVSTGTKTLLATLPASFGAIAGLAAGANGAAPTLNVAGPTSDVVLDLADTHGSTVTTADRLSSTPGAGGGGFAYVGANSSAGNRDQMWTASPSTGLVNAQSGASTALLGAVGVHYHGRPDHLYAVTPSALWMLDLGTGVKTRIWPGIIPLVMNGAEKTTDAGPDGPTTFSFQGVAGQRIGVVTGHILNYFEGVTVRAPDGTVLSESVCCLADRFSDAIGPLPATGTYTITFTNMAAKTVAARVFTIGPDPVAALPLGGGDVSQLVVDPGQDTHFTFDATAGDTVGIEFTNPFGCWSLDVNLRVPSGAGVVYNNNQGYTCDGSQHPLILGPLPETGTYSLDLGPRDLGVGTVTARAWLVPAPVTVDVPVNGTVQSATLTEPGQQAVFRFTGTAGQTVAAEIGGNYGWRDSTIIKNPDGSDLWANGCCDSPRSTGRLTLTQSGTYTLTLSPRIATTVTLKVQNIPADATATASIGGGAVDVSVVAQQKGVITFAGTAGQQVSAVLAGPYYWRASGVYIANPDGSRLWDSGCCDSPRGTGTLTLPQTGTYSMVFDTGAEGTMTGKVDPVP